MSQSEGTRGLTPATVFPRTRRIAGGALSEAPQSFVGFFDPADLIGRLFPCSRRPSLKLMLLR